MSVELLWAVRGKLSWCNATLHFACLLLQSVFAIPGNGLSEVRNVLQCIVSMERWHRTSMGRPLVAAVSMYMLKYTPYSYFYIRPTYTAAELAGMY